SEHALVFAIDLHVRVLERHHLAESRVDRQARGGGREQGGEDGEYDEPGLAMLEDERRDGADQRLERHFCGLGPSGSATSRGPVSPRSRSLSVAPRIGFAKARVVPVGIGTKDAPWSRLTSAVPAEPASTIEPSGSFSPPTSAVVEGLSTCFHVRPLSVERKMCPRSPKARMAPLSATSAPKKDPL